MIPLQIKLKNFLSYGPELQTIDFQPHYLICLTGKNGHGKSALLDALTWGLWGQARKISGTAKADQGLLRLGQSSMMVVVDFMCGQHQYRVKREFIAGKVKVQLYLDFGMYDQDLQMLRPLTGKTIRETQSAINRVLGLDYETFSNSAFLRQGQSNAFSLKSPKERKEILGTILGLDRFEKVRKLILEEQRSVAAHKDYLAHTLERLEQELAQEKECIQALQQLQQDMQEATNKEHQLNLHLQALATQKNGFEQEQQQLNILQVDYEHTAQQLLTYEKELKELILVWRSVHSKAARIIDKKKLHAKRKELDAHLADLHAKQQERMALKEKLFSLKEQEQLLVRQQEKKFSECLYSIDIELDNLKNRQEFIQKHHREHQASIEKMHADLSMLAPSYAASQALDAQVLADLAKKYEIQQAVYTRLRARHEHIVKEFTKVHRKGALVGTTSFCPLCQQTLDQDYRAALHDTLRSQLELLQHQQKRLEKILQQAPDRLKAEHERIKALQERYQQAQKYIQLSKQLDDAHQQQKLRSDQINEQALLLQELQNRRAAVIKQQSCWRQHHEEYQDLQEQISQLTTLATSIIYDEKLHQALIHEQREIMVLLEEHETIFDELKEQPLRKARIHELCAIMRAIKKNLQLLDTKLQGRHVLALRLREIMSQAQALEIEINALNPIKAALLEKKGRLEQLHHHLTRQKEEAKTIQSQINTYEKQLKYYHVIATALGKDGIQALLIEEMLPELEYETNRLLIQLTDNTQQIFIESLRDLKSGGTKETLDIKISDALGIRPYELFSGGEAFRIDFALRIALSILLARRAGASLQTLVIDEGFGSQDEEGLSRIMDALHRIQDNFAKIIIVSHLPTMQHQFPSQFHIMKGPQGSQVHVLQQG